MFHFHFALRSLRKLSDMLSAFVHRLEQTVEAFRKCLVTRAATKSSRFFEVRLRKSADRTLLRGCAFFNFFRRADAKEQIRERETGWILHTFFLRAGFAQIHLLHLAFQNLRQENRCVIAFTNVAQHTRLIKPRGAPQVQPSISSEHRLRQSRHSALRNRSACRSSGSARENAR